ncbi:MAG: aminotransferase class III-fold pyridoxal phosphate-dependent enzyme [Gemmatimonadaceae bacterium]
MPFKRLFGLGGAAEPSQPPDDVEEDVPEAHEEGEPEGALDADGVERDWRQRAADVIPGGTSTGSKGPAALYGPDTEHGPTHFVAAQGCRLTTPAGRTLIDCTMALGSVAVGYADEAVGRAVLAVVANGHVAGLASTLEVEVAERLCDVIPCAEQVRFLKSGAEAVSAAVRIARAATGRTKVIGCGYFGWHDWSNSGPGIPDGARADFAAVPFDDVAALERAARAAGSSLAAIILEPVIDRLPSPEWCVIARRLCDELGAVLIFDELKTGFRLAPGGYQEYAKVEPDLAAFGKAMSNGFPIAAVVGRAAIMASLASTWVSSTLAGESMGLAAVGAVLDIHEEVNVCETLWRAGAQMRGAVSNAVEASGFGGVQVTGIDPMWTIAFEDAGVQRGFLERAAFHGVLFKRGAYNYASVAHDDDEIVLEIERVASTSLVELQEELAR